MVEVVVARAAVGRAQAQDEAVAPEGVEAEAGAGGPRGPQAPASGAQGARRGDAVFVNSVVRNSNICVNDWLRSRARLRRSRIPASNGRADPGQGARATRPFLSKTFRARRRLLVRRCARKRRSGSARASFFVNARVAAARQEPLDRFLPRPYLRDGRTEHGSKGCQGRASSITCSTRRGTGRTTCRRLATPSTSTSIWPRITSASRGRQLQRPGSRSCSRACLRSATPSVTRTIPGAGRRHQRRRSRRGIR